MATTAKSDRLRQFIDLVVESLDAPADPARLAQRAYLSRFHFDRLLKAALRESPVAFRRRLLLERAAWQLQATEASVTEAAFDAGYASLEAFTRAFQRGFGVAPSSFRRQGASGRLEAPNGIHFHPPGGLFIPSDREGRDTMDLVDRLVEHDVWLTRELLERARALDDTQLDERIPLDHEPQPWEAEEPTVRAMLDRLVRTKEIWTAAYKGRVLSDDRDTTLDGLRGRLAAAGEEFTEMVREARSRDAWDDGFVDALCDPPESFTVGGMVAHVLTFDAYRRQQLLLALRHHGLEDLGYGDPIAWERAQDGKEHHA
jgi:AraC-like DNA-binding protein